VPLVQYFPDNYLLNKRSSLYTVGVPGGVPPRAGTADGRAALLEEAQQVDVAYSALAADLQRVAQRKIEVHAKLEALDHKKKRRRLVAIGQDGATELTDAHRALLSKCRTLPDVLRMVQLHAPDVFQKVVHDIVQAEASAAAKIPALKVREPVRLQAFTELSGPDSASERTCLYIYVTQFF
jgi:hypothetical protein